MYIIRVHGCTYLVAHSRHVAQATMLRRQGPTTLSHELTWDSAGVTLLLPSDYAPVWGCNTSRPEARTRSRGPFQTHVAKTIQSEWTGVDLWHCGQARPASSAQGSARLPSSLSCCACPAGSQFPQSSLGISGRDL